FSPRVDHPPTGLSSWKATFPERRRLRLQRPSLHLHPDNHAAVEGRVRQEPTARVRGGQLLAVSRDRVQLRGFPRNGVKNLAAIADDFVRALLNLSRSGEPLPSPPRH